MENISFLATQVGFIVLTFIFYGILISGLKSAIAKTSWEELRKKKVFKKILIPLIGWTFLISVGSLADFFSDFKAFPPRFVIVLLVPMITILFVTFSKTTKELLLHIPALYLIRLQVFRVFVEILLWMLFLQNLLPVQMTFEGRNFDVLAGISAPIVAYFFTNNRTLMIVWNILCLGLLINIVATALLSMPTPFRLFVNEPSGIIITTFPFIWLPGLLVPLAYGLHFVSLTQLSGKNDI